eukprot:966483-Pleurochrysis_carterae.AAC.1
MGAHVRSMRGAHAHSGRVVGEKVYTDAVDFRARQIADTGVSGWSGLEKTCWQLGRRCLNQVQGKESRAGEADKIVGG